MTQQDGDKPQLTVVASNPTPQTYTQLLGTMVAELSQRKLKGEKINPFEVLQFLDTEEDNTPIKEWLAAHGIITKAKFDKMLARMEHDERVKKALGFVPTDAKHFIEEYTRLNKITVSPRGVLERARPFEFGGVVIDATNANQSPDAKLIYDVANADSDNTEALLRDLRLLSDQLGLGFRDSVITDAFQAWQAGRDRQAKVQVFCEIQYERGKATGQIGAEMWRSMEAACFDVSNTCPGFAIAVVKKFMWQVKRKARGLNVTNHLMPVLTGVQGKGKSEFVKAMAKPLADLMRSVDFNLLCDGKTSDIWSASILFIDEMGFFKKQDVDQVKNIITTPELSIRTMRQNHSTVVRNAATLIGCSNKSLGELIRDDTGVRRFAELEWSKEPDWEASNSIDWQLLWQSVDEEAEDPMFALNMMDKLREQQESNRNQTPVEQWARELGHTIKDWKRSADLHLSFREWEKDAHPRADTNLTMFGRQLTTLVNNHNDFPLEKKVDREGAKYCARKFV